MKPIHFPLFLIPLLPLLGAAISLIFGRRMRRQSVHLVAVGAVVAACVVALVAIFGHLFGDVSLWSLRQGWFRSGATGAPRMIDTAYTWIASGGLEIKAGFLLDPLSAVMVLVVTVVGSLIHIYSCGYMAADKDYARFFGYMNLFTGAMLILVLADNLVLTFVGWEGVGLCSYLLIGFWYEKDANASAGKKAFIVNRIGDFGFILGMLLIWATVGTLDYVELASGSGYQALLAKNWHFFYQGVDMLTGQKVYLLSVQPAHLIAICLFIGAMGKSAQIPLYVWLPDAMAGPTPVSALIHAATMVTAGVYMVARLNFLYILSPGIMLFVASIGAVTALYAATIAFAQNDIKKVLAYSTVSQLGFMFTAVGVGAFGAGIFHLATHAFFKACLFLCAGAVIHALHEEQDIREMGGLRKLLPVTHWTFLVSCVTIAGLPFFSGFFSKDMIILGTAVNTLTKANNDVLMLTPAVIKYWTYTLWGILSLASLCTAFYMFRLYALTFLGANRTNPEVIAKLHTPSNSMRWPLIILAGGATLLGVLGLPSVMAGKDYGIYFFAGTILAAAFLIWLAFFFANDVDASHGEDKPASTLWIVQVPLTAIAALLVFLGACAKWPILMGKIIPPDYINKWLALSVPAFDNVKIKTGYLVDVAKGNPNVSHHWELIFMGIATLLAIVGVGAALAIYRRGPSQPIGSLVASMGGLYRLIYDKYRIDELYDLLIVRPLTWFAWFLRVGVDEFLVDKVLVTGVSYVVYGLGWLGTQLQSGRARQYIAAVLVGLGVMIFLVTRPVSPLSPMTLKVRGNTVHVRAGSTTDKVVGVAHGAFKTRVAVDCNGDGKIQANEKAATPTSWVNCRFAKPGKHKIRMVVEDKRFGTRSETTRVATIAKERR
jgi:NADH-quinone oxidoreductase subunit L